MDSSKSRSLSLSQDIHFKIVVLGTAGAGKSSITIRFTKNIFPEEYIPTLLDTHRTTQMIDDQLSSLEIVDTAGMEHYQSMLDLWINDGNGFILVYSVADQETLNELRLIYEKIRNLHSGNIKPPVFIVGNKIDLQQDQKQISEQMGIDFISSLNGQNCHHILTSAKYGTNVNQLFQQIVREMRQNREHIKKQNKKQGNKKKKKKKWWQCNLI
ncbi:P-loop containing nucleoside triphosphate hydrolase [Pseudocohnilembus persalinus]|uniref:p-loop containing nucleoside triphosphate hydrolase n=1 Tax=Pseudocohnilembus persalinus TaxID=266149 RepID=A0A0V0QTN3_PSEPJ|nr:P-loop containing nucleoside triphosphate hydrolase [Pseudocohnilembus persalinus]|eukprot:KRX05753.1 P-loop containing nucleoside triphosphate hydrolase [Pseudocohnilembus persalinus]